jgi:hypothetical protein
VSTSESGVESQQTNPARKVPFVIITYKGMFKANQHQQSVLKALAHSSY